MEDFYSGGAKVGISNGRMTLEGIGLAMDAGKFKVLVSGKVVWQTWLGQFADCGVIVGGVSQASGAASFNSLVVDGQADSNWLRKTLLGAQDRVRRELEEDLKTGALEEMPALPKMSIDDERRISTASILRRFARTLRRIEGFRRAASPNTGRIGLETTRICHSERSEAKSRNPLTSGEEAIPRLRPDCGRDSARNDKFTHFFA